MTKISIIVPIYSVAEYLPKCLDSLVNQTLRDIEIILASDGPQDCHDICDEYAKHDNRVTVIKNLGGYGKSVNEGIKIAKGEYIGIVESDDWIAPEMYEKLYLAAKNSNADIAKCGFWFAFDNPEKNNASYFSIKDEAFSLEEKPEAILFRQTIWSAIYKTEWIKQEKIYFCEKRLSYIDAPFQAEAFIKARKIAALKDPLYFYYQDNPDQSMQKIIKFATDGIEVKKIMLKKIPAIKILNSKIRSAYIYHICRDVFNDYHRYNNNTDKKIFWNNARSLLLSDDFKKIDYYYFSDIQKIFIKFLKKYRTHKIYDIYVKFDKLGLKENLFSVKNTKNKSHKLVTILGIKLKFKRRKA